MADVFDSTEEKKAQIAEISETQQKAILCQGNPKGIYRFFDSSGAPRPQQIDYVANVEAILFTSSNRVCFYEQTLSNGGKQWLLLGNGNYKLSQKYTLSYNNMGFIVQAKDTQSVPPHPVNKNWSWELDWIKTHYMQGTSLSTVYNNINNAKVNSSNYGISGSYMGTKEFVKDATKITDNFKIGYFEEYATTNSIVKFNNNPPNYGTVAKNFSIFNFISNDELYNKILNLGFIPLCRKPTEQASQISLSPNQAYYDEDIPVGGYHRFYNVIVTSDYQQALDYINNGTIPDDARITDSSGNDVSLVEEDDGQEDDGYKIDLWIDTKENEHPVQSQLSAGTNFFYKMSTAQLTTFITWFWNDIDINDILINAVTGLYNNMAECVLSVKYYLLLPTSEDFFRTSEKSIILGRFSTEANYTKINSCAGNGKLCTFELGENKDKYLLYSSNSRPHAFTDYAPYTDIYLFLPFYGYHKLDTNLVMERRIDINYSLDITTGILDYNIKMYGTTIDTISCNFGIDVPYTLSSMLELGTNIAQSVADVAISAGTNIANNYQSSVTPAKEDSKEEVPKPSKGGSNLVGNSFAPPALNINGKVSNGVGLYHCLKPYLIIKHPRYYRAKNYGKIEGYPCMKAYKLSTLEGYTECERPQIQKFNSGTPTADEIGEILNILSNGIVIR